MKQLLFSLCLLLLVGSSAFAQETFPMNGVYDAREGLYAFTNATIFTKYDTKIEGATLVIRKGKIEAVGQEIAIPKGAVVFDLKGKYIYPSFIDLYTSYGVPAAKAVGNRSYVQPQMLTNKDGAYAWNEALKPEFHAGSHFKADNKEAKQMRTHGFGAVLTHQMDGINRGTSAFVTLGDEREHLEILKPTVATHFSFNKGVSTQNYPSSLMGAIALLRQTYYDAIWYKNGGEKKEKNLSLQAWNENMKLAQIFEVRDRLEALRAAKIGEEFGLKYIFMGSGDEYQRIEELKATGSAFIIPLNFPSAFDVEDPFNALQADLGDMKHWELAPTNPAQLDKAGIEFAFTTHKLKSAADFMKNLRTAIENGLSETAALKALTFTPAKLIGVSDQVGSIEKGKVANFLVTSGNIFDEKTTLHHNWVSGKGHVINELNTTDLRGTYLFEVGDQTDSLMVTGALTKPSMELKINDSTTVKVKHSFNNGLVSISFNREKDVTTTLSGTLQGKNWSGRGTLPNGDWVNWTATFVKEFEEAAPKKEQETASETPEFGSVVYPFMAFGWKEKPTQKTYLIKNATVWTNEAAGILENTDVLVQNGKIAKVGKNLTAPEAIEIDGTGKHLTSGIIDEHSHIAISRGVNEGSQYSSAEVSIGDVVNSEDINIYRQLSGGVTTAQLLHGSANPIGGQSAIIKLRWGFAPEAMKFKGAAPFIKFALGENVKQSNWGDENRIRFPQTRMGVEQVYEDHFTRARAYGEEKKKNPNLRKNLEMETLLQILEKERFITCHSYVQSEINMLMKVAEKHGFVLNTFTHILEGYKVADKMAKHGAGGSSFSDWWAYKYEVIDAIPYNGALMHSQGVTVAFNSDDAEMARRLNQEAAKAVMYGGVSEEDAWKFVTLNPAKLLHIDDRVGSIKVGKDADIVLWTDHPLSVYARAEKTLIDGMVFFDLKQDKELREEVKTERARLVQKMLNAKKGGAKTRPVSKKQKHLYHCDDFEEEIRD